MVDPIVTPPRTYDKWAAMQKAVVIILKRRFPNLTVEETLDLATQIVRAAVEAVLSLEDQR